MALLAATTPVANAQQSPPTYHFSVLSHTFDAPLPIGKAFEIKGAAASDIVGVVMQSAGYQHHLPRPFTDPASTTDEAFCEALKQARTADNVHYTEIGWDRSGTPATEFTVTHPRLYYGRSYAFFFTYLKPVDREMIRGLAQQVIAKVVAQVSDFQTLMREGLTETQLRPRIENAIAGVKEQRRSCLPYIVERDLRESNRFWTSVNDSLLRSIANLATRQQRSQAFTTSTAETQKTIAALPTTIPPEVVSALAPTGLIARMQVEAKAKNWAAVDATLQELLDAIAVLPVTAALTQASIAKAADAVNALKFGPLLALTSAQADLEGLAEATPDGIAQFVASRYNPDSLAAFLYAASVRPYAQTMREALPFIVSLDGGVTYAWRFRQLIPTVALNVKLNRVDFDDPFNRRPEFSVLVGLGMASPDDLDPDYEGIFSNSNRSLLVALGVRPGFAPLLRGSVGVLVFRQHDRNPLVKDLTTKASLVLGASVNWDVLDFAATLVKDRPTLGVGGL